MRRGATLAELLVALVLGAIVCGLVAKSVTAQRRSERAIAASSSGTSIADETIGVLTTALERVAASDTIRLRSDTAIDFGLTIGSGLACASGADSIVLLESGTTSWWESIPDSGDTIDGMSDGQWWRAEVVASRARTAVAGKCAGAQRVLNVRPFPPAGADLPVVRVTRRTRFMVYRGGDGLWWLGERTCNAAVTPSCSSAQPVAGPLANARALLFALDTVSSIPVVAITASAGRSVRTATVPLRP